MSALFSKSSDTVFRVVLAILLGTPAIAIGALMLYVRVPMGTGQHDPKQQPVQFDHRHHVQDLGLDCRYCHFSVESAPSAGMPATQLCMGCHNQVWNKSPILDPVRELYFTDRPIPWERVHNLPDFVYFDHSIHVAKGVGCASCHGRVDTMPSVSQAEPLSMKWCLDCHRNPGPNLRPKDQITNMAWAPPDDGGKLAAELIESYDVHTRTSCTTCHR